jgi:dienelactone hydrolase
MKSWRKSLAHSSVILTVVTIIPWSSSTAAPLKDRFLSLEWLADNCVSESPKYGYRLYAPTIPYPTRSQTQDFSGADGNETHSDMVKPARTKIPDSFLANPEPDGGSNDVEYVDPNPSDHGPDKSASIELEATAPGNANRWPLLIWFHGAGARGVDNFQQLRHVDVIFGAAKGQPPLFILAIQHHKDEGWAGNNSSRSDALSITFDVLQHVISTYPVDRDRIYVTGISTGGNACWEFAMRYHDHLAAAAPISSFGADLARAADFAKLPVWAFNSSVDGRAKVARVQPMIEAIQKAGGVAALTATAGAPGIWSHDSWTAAFEDHRLLDWLLAQQRGASVTMPPTNKFLSEVVRWFKGDGGVLTVWIVVVIATVTAWSYRRRHARLAPIKNQPPHDM